MEESLESLKKNIAGNGFLVILLASQRSNNYNNKTDM